MSDRPIFSWNTCGKLVLCIHTKVVYASEHFVIRSLRTWKGYLDWQLTKTLHARIIVRRKTVDGHNLTGRLNVRVGPQLEKIARDLAQKVQAGDLSDYIRGLLFLDALKEGVALDVLDEIAMPPWLKKA